jgi:hypothetical protein
MSTGIVGGNIVAQKIIVATWDVPSITANTTQESTFTLKGVKLGDYVAVVNTSLNEGAIFGTARVTAADTVGVQLGNFTGSAIDPASKTVQIYWARPEGIPSSHTNLSF